MKAKYIGTNPIIHNGGRRFIPGKVYDFTEDEWAKLVGLGIFKIEPQLERKEEKTERKFDRKKRYDGGGN